MDFCLSAFYFINKMIVGLKVGTGRLLNFLSNWLLAVLTHHKQFK